MAVSIPEETWDKVGRCLCELRRRGVAVPFTDALLATIGLERDVQVWTYDRHCRLMAEVFPVKLYDAAWT